MPRTDASGGGFSSWMGRWWRALVSEVLCTALLVLLGPAAVVPVHGGPVPLTHPAFSFGLVIIINVQVFGPISGAHMNPAVTLAAVLYGQMDVLVGLAYFVAETVGAMLGFGGLMWLSPAAALRGGVGCTTLLVSPAAGAAVEALLTAALVLLCCACWSAPPDPTAPLKIGLGVAGLVYAGGAMTGASLNPVRSLAPAIYQNVWKDHWVYWVGPLGGSVLAALLHRYVLCSPPHRPEPPLAAEELPLHDKPAPAP